MLKGKGSKCLFYKIFIWRPKTQIMYERLLSENRGESTP
jgi:hypothetical protein